MQLAFTSKAILLLSFDTTFEKVEKAPWRRCLTYERFLFTSHSVDFLCENMFFRKLSPSYHARVYILHMLDLYSIVDLRVITYTECLW